MTIKKLHNWSPKRLLIKKVNELIDGGGGAGSGDISADYKFTQNANDELVLKYKNKPVSMMSPDGSWFTDSVSTGVGSLHLGGNDSGGVAHSISSTGQNVGFKNEFSAIDPRKKWFFSPAWESCTIDGTERKRASFRYYQTLNTAFLPNGEAHASINLDYNFEITAATNSDTYLLAVIPAENYTGKLQNSIVSNVTGAEIYNTVEDVAATAGNELQIPYSYPLTVRIGDVLQLKLIKENGQYLRVRAGVTNTAIPYRRLEMATFGENEICRANNWTADRALITSPEGKVTLSALTSAMEIQNISGQTPRNSSIDITDSDGFVFNDGGNMIQVAAARVWTYIVSRITGAASSILTSNLTPNKSVVTNGFGKIATFSHAANSLVTTNDTGELRSSTVLSPNALIVSNSLKLPVSLSLTTGKVVVSDALGLPSASSVSTDSLSSFVGVSKFITTARPVSGTTSFTVNDSPIRALTINIDVTSTTTNIMAVHSASAGLGVLKTVFASSSTSPATTKNSISSGGSVTSLSNSSSVSQISQGLIYSESDANQNINFRIYIINPTTTASWIKVDVW